MKAIDITILISIEPVSGQALECHADDGHMRETGERMARQLSEFFSGANHWKPIEALGARVRLSHGVALREVVS